MRSWCDQTTGIAALDASSRFPPCATPGDLQANKTAIWSLPGAKPLARTIQALKGKVQLRRNHYITDALLASRLLFIHIPKNAGTSVAEKLYGRTLGHRSAQFYKAALPGKLFDECVRFAVLRDPRERFVSAFTYLKQHAYRPADIAFRDRWLGEVEDIVVFIELFQSPDFRKAMMNWPHFRDQCQFICDKQGMLLIDYVFSMRALDKANAFVDAVLGESGVIGKTNASSRGAAPDLDWRIVDEVYAEDQRLFDYLARSEVGVVRTSSAQRRGC